MTDEERERRMEETEKLLNDLLAEQEKESEEIKKLGLFGGSRRIAVNKTTHRIRFEGETEDSVVIVVEPKEALQ